VIASFMVIGAVPAGAAISTSASCPSSIPSAGFADIASFDATTQTAINCVAFYGISKGTSTTTFDPNGSVSRWQMALFLTRQAVDHGLTLGDGSTQGFTDIGALDAATQTAINQLKQLGITSGTSATTFDPTGLVPRWQMALFMTRLAAKAGFTLGTGADQGFTDLTGLDAATVTAINQAKQAGIADGTSATTFVPLANTLRWQMALFLTRVLAVDGVVPTGLGNIVTATDTGNNKVTVADAAQAKTVVISYANTDKFTVDGLAATVGSFEASVTVGDVLAVAAGTPQTVILTNKTAADYVSGPIDDVDTVGATYDIVEPISGAILNNDLSYAGTYTLHQTDGAAASQAGFGDDLNAGDTVSSTGANTITSLRTINVTNKTISGTVSGVAGASPNTTFNIGAFADAFNPVATDTLTVGGSSKTDVEVDAALSNGDAATYARDNAKQTIALTNQASAPITGKVLNNNESVANTVDVDVAGVASNDQAYGNAGTVYIVNGLLDDLVGLETANTAGDSISIVRADGVINTVDRVTLTDAAFSGTPGTLNPGAGGDLTITFVSGGPAETEAIVIDSLTPDVGLTGTGLVKYTVGSNTAATQAQFEANVAAAIANNPNTGTVSVAKVGNDIVWTFTA
jgi:hypothetical protein